MPYGKNKSKVVENYITYIINQTPFEIINESCKNYGSSFIGRCESTEYLTGVKYKCPIVISEVKEIIMFPTLSAKCVNCVWINYHGILKYYNSKPKELTIILKNNRRIFLELSNRIISNQIFKSSRLESVIKSKKH